jgi:hypothetical protein
VDVLYRVMRRTRPGVGGIGHSEPRAEEGRCRWHGRTGKNQEPDRKVQSEETEREKELLLVARRGNGGQWQWKGQRQKDPKRGRYLEQPTGDKYHGSDKRN